MGLIGLQPLNTIVSMLRARHEKDVQVEYQQREAELSAPHSIQSKCLTLSSVGIT